MAGLLRMRRARRHASRSQGTGPCAISKAGTTHG
jgi:hypothetical protein